MWMKTVGYDHYNATIIKQHEMGDYLCERGSYSGYKKDCVRFSLLLCFGIIFIGYLYSECWMLKVMLPTSAIMTKSLIDIQ